MQHDIPYDPTTVGGQAGGLVPNVFAVDINVTQTNVFVVDIDVTQNLAGQQPPFEQSTDVSNVTTRQTPFVSSPTTTTYMFALESCSLLEGVTQVIWNLISFRPNISL